MFSDHRNMVFVDGENFTIRGQELAKRKGLKLEEGTHWQEDVYLWMPGCDGDMPRYASAWAWRGGQRFLTEVVRSARAYYYTAIPGGDTRKLKKTRLALRGLNFDPEVFIKKRGEVTKGVDVSLTTSLVSHAYLDDYDVAFLICGDGDYVPVVEAIRRAGKRVVVAFFGQGYGLSPDLRIAADRYIDLEDYFLRSWREMYRERELQAEYERKQAAQAAKRQALKDAN